MVIINDIPYIIARQRSRAEFGTFEDIYGITIVLFIYSLLAVKSYVGLLSIENVQYLAVYNDTESAMYMELRKSLKSAVRTPL